MARIVVPFDGGPASEYALDVACRTACEGGDEVHAVYVSRIPYQLPISAQVPGAHARAECIFARAHTIADRHQADLIAVLIEARETGPAIVEAAEGCDIIMIGPRPRRRLFGRFLFGRTVRYVLAHASCPVLIGYEPAATATAASAPDFHLLVRRDPA